MSLQGGGGGGPPLNPHSHLTGGGIQIGVPQTKRFNGRRRTSDSSPVTDRSMSLAGRTGLIVAGTSAVGPAQPPDNKIRKNESKNANEKRRRCTENHYTDQLAALISLIAEGTGLPGNGSVKPKPDKCAVLQNTIEQLKKLSKNSEHHGGTDLQGNQVSSSKSNIMGLDVLGPLQLQALDGFILLINSEGVIQFVSENVVIFLGQTPSELESRNIFDLVHRDDASKISANLRLADIHQSQGPRRCSFHCKFLCQVNASDNGSPRFDDVGSGTHLVSLHKDINRARYVEMYLISTIIPKNQGGHSSGSPPSPGGNCLLSIVRRVSPLEYGQVSTGLSAVEDNMKQSIAGCSSLGSVEQFSVRLNQFGRLVKSDLSNLGEPYSQILKQSLVEGRLFEELCEPAHRAEFRQHFQAALDSNEPQGFRYSLRAIPEKPLLPVHVKFTKFDPPNQSIIVVAVHSIFVDDLKELDKEHSSVSPPMGSIALTNNQSNLHSNSANTLVLKGASGSGNGSTAPSIPQQNLGTNDGNNNTSFGGMGKNSEKLRNLLILGKSGCNSNSSSPLSIGAGASAAAVGAGSVPPSGHTILKKLLNNSADAGAQGPVEAVQQETKRHSIFLAGKKNDNLIEAPDAKRSRPDAQLACQNPMLASMLATPMPVSSVPPPMTNSISQLPQDRLPKNLEQKLLPTPIPSTSGQCSSSTNTLSTSSAHPLMAMGHSSPSASGGELELSQILEDVWKLEEERTQIPSSPAPTTPTTVNSLSTSQSQSAIDTSAQPGLMPISPITNSPVLTLMGGGMMPPLGGSESPQSSLQTLLTSPVPSPRPQIPVSLASGHMIKSPGSHTPILVAQNSSPANALVLPGPPVASPLTNTSTHDDHSNSPSILSISSPSSFPLGGGSPPLVPPVVLRNVAPPPVVNMPQHLGNNQEALLQEILEDLVDEKIAPSVSPMDAKQAISEIERHLMSTSNSIVSEPYLGPQRLPSQPMQMGPPMGMNLGMQIQIPSQQPQLQQQQHHMSTVTRLGYQQGGMVTAVPRGQLRMMGVPMGHGAMGVVVQQQQAQSMAGNANFKLQQQQLQRQKLLETQQMARLLANQQNQHMPQQQQQQSLSLQQQQQQHQQQQSQQAHLQLINDSEPPPNVSLQPASPKWPIPPRMGGPMVPGAQHLRAQPQPYPQGPLQ